MEQEAIPPKQIAYILVVVIAILGLLFFFTRQKNGGNNLAPANKEAPLSAEEKYRILEELNKQSSATAVVSEGEKLDTLRSLEKGSATVISASEKLRLLNELQNKK